MATSHLAELGYIGFEVTDTAAWASYAATVLGLGVEAGPLADTLRLRMDDHAYRILVVPGEADDIAFAGWRAVDDHAFVRFLDHLRRQGVAFHMATQSELTLRGVERMAHFRDPEGNRHEAYVGQTLAETPFTSAVTEGGFMTGEGGLGHVVYGASDYAAAIAFARDVLGMRLSDTIQQALPSGRVLDVSFLHLNERHHSLAYSDLAGRKRLHHFMLEVARIEDAGRARDRQKASGLAVAMDLGQHPNDQMVSFYGTTPSGFFVEYGWGGVKIDDAAWSVGNYDRLSDWGHRPPSVGQAPS